MEIHVARICPLIHTFNSMAHRDNAKSNSRAALRLRGVFSLFSHSRTPVFPWAWGNGDPSLPCLRKLDRRLLLICLQRESTSQRLWNPLQFQEFITPSTVSKDKDDVPDESCISSSQTFFPEIICKQITNTGNEICVKRFLDCANYSVHFKHQEKKSSINQCCCIPCYSTQIKRRKRLMSFNTLCYNRISHLIA